jgi:predicted oxidoreductase
MTERIILADTLEVSRIVWGLWRLMEWQMPTEKLLSQIEESLELGVSTFDHADIYGDYSCEAAFGKALQRKPQLREKMQLISKCGIKLVSPRYPERKLPHYDTSYAHIIRSVESSLKNLQTDYLDLLLIHRPDPLMDPADTARAFEQLEKEGKVRHFGVSNFTPGQYEMLNAWFPGKLVTNQVEISAYYLEHFQNGNMDFFLKEKLHPMAWSPVGGGSLFNPTNEKGKRLQQKLSELAERKSLDGIDKLLYAWLLQHPAKIIPIVGSGKMERLRRAVESLTVDLSREEWFEIWVASLGHPVP